MSQSSMPYEDYTPEQKLDIIMAFIPQNETQARGMLLSLYYDGMRLNEMRDTVNPDKEYPHTHG